MKVELDGATVFVGTGHVDWSVERPTLVLLHGAGMDRTVWVLLARYFARHGWNVVAPDWPAHGKSGGDVLTTIEAQADWMWRLLDRLREPGAASGSGRPDGTNGSGDDGRLGDAPLVIGGHSMGALAAVAMAGERPDAIARLLLLGVGYPMGVGAPLLEAAQANERTAVDMITIYGHAHASRLGRNTLAGISVVNQAAALIERAAPGVLHADLAACNAWSGAEAAAEAFGAGRATIVAGDEDRMTPGRGTATLAGLLDADVLTLADCGHMLMSEQPEATLRAMRTVLADVALRTPGR